MEQIQRTDAASYSRGYHEGYAAAIEMFRQQIDAAVHSRPVQIIIPKDSAFSVSPPSEGTVKPTDKEISEYVEDKMGIPQPPPVAPSEGEGKEDEARVQLALRITKLCKFYEEGSVPDDIGMTIMDMVSPSSPSQELPGDYEKITCQKCSGVGYTQESHGSSYTDTRCDWCNGHGRYFRQKPEQDRSTNQSRSRSHT